MVSREAANANSIVIGSTRPEIKPTIYHTRDENANHYTTDAVRPQLLVLTKWNQTNQVQILCINITSISFAINLWHFEWHIFSYVVEEYGFLNEKKLKEVKIKFDYTGSSDCDESNIFEVEPKIFYKNETLDTAILRLKPNGKVTFPPPFKRLDHFLVPAEDEDQTIYLIGHPHGSPQRVNLDVGLWNPTEKRMLSLATFCKEKGYEYGYAELDKSERLVVKCQFEHGASGCPGVVVLDDNKLYLVTMFLRGFPDFYFNRLFKGQKKEKFPKCKLFQQGVNIRAIYEDLKKNPIYADIFQDIFNEPNPLVNTGPSGIIQSENYIDGYQDCHGGISTSIQPTSDEGTHHVTSPCEEETNENVSTCTHPTTVERQGSQIVVSGQ